jgi:uncharacterized membrane protein
MGTVLIIIHYLSFAVAIGGGVANMFAAIQMKSAPPEAMPHLGAVQRNVGRASFGALIMLWITGGWMMSNAGGAAEMPSIFWVKITFVLALTVISTMLQYHSITAARAGTPPPAAKMAKLSQLAGLCAIAAVILAATAFH